MEWVIGFLVIVVVVLSVLGALLFVGNECKEQTINQCNNEYQKLLCKYEHILTQIGEHGFTVRISYSDACYVEIKNEHT